MTITSLETKIKKSNYLLQIWGDKNAVKRIIQNTNNNRINTYKAITIIGSRKSSTYGNKVVKEIIKNLVEDKVTISGFAKGIDLEVFKKSISNNITTICCLGYGLNYLPNKKKLQQLVDKGQVIFISQFKKEQSPTKWTYPKRDLLLADLSNICILIEAEEKSGTKYTINRCIRNKTKVYTVPGSIFSKTSEGTNKLLERETKNIEILNTIGKVKNI